jgi:hypothetical protein
MERNGGYLKPTTWDVFTDLFNPADRRGEG